MRWKKIAAMENHRTWLCLSLVLSLAVPFVVYALRLPETFVGLDVMAYARILNSSDHLATARTLFTDFSGKLVIGYYAPLGSLSLMLDKWLIGSSAPCPKFTHFVNLTLHCVNGILIWLLLRNLNIAPWVRCATVYLFLIHPIQVSSIEWFAERKTFLAAIFYFGSYYLYLKYLRSGLIVSLVASLAAFVLGLLSKPTNVVLPVVLLVTGMVLPRDDPNGLNNSESREHRFPLDRRTILSLSPFFAIALFWSALTLQTEATPDPIISLFHRPLVAAAALWFYAIHVVAPVNLMYVYPRWVVSASEPTSWAPLIALTLVAWLLYRYRRLVSPGIWWGLANFLVPLLPVIGFFQFGYLRYSFVADHFVYIALMAASFLMATAIAATLKRLRGPLKLAAVTAVAAYMVFLPIQTWIYAGAWQNQTSLWTDNVRKCPSCWLAHNELGVALQQAGSNREAIPHLRRATEIRPQEAKPHNDLGVALMEVGDLQASRNALNKALHLKPNSAEAHNNMGLLMKRLGNLPEAKSHFLKAIQEGASLPQAYNNLGRLFETEGNIDLAAENYRRALALAPNSPDIHSNLGNVLIKGGSIDEAIGHYEAALRAKPDHFASLFNLAAVYINTSRFSDAAALLRRALAVNPHSIEAQEALKLAIEEMKHPSP